ncbi:MAG: hypothetical protein ACAH95_12875 [Fimbriimonas sp.]
MRLYALTILLGLSIQAATAQTSWRKPVQIPGYEITCPTAVDYDKDGNIFVLGTAKNAATPEDVFLIKCNGSGRLLWQRVFAGPSGETDTSNSLAIDATGNAYVGVTSKNGDALQTNIVALKYAADGTLTWTGEWDGGNRADNCKSISPCPDGGAVVAGASFNDTNYDAITLRFSAAGTLAWTNIFDTGGNDWGVKARSDGSGRITAIATGEHGLNSDVAVLRFDAAGARTWQVWLGPENRTADRAITLAADTAGNTYVASQTFSIEKKWDFQISKLSSKGVILWNTKYDRAALDDYLVDMAIDNQDGLYVTGTSSLVLNNFDVTTLKLNRTSGAVAWQRHWGVPVDRPEQTAVALATNPTGQTALTYQLRTARRADIRTEVNRLNPNGSLIALTAEQQDLLRQAYSEPIAIALRPNGIAYLVGVHIPSITSISGFLIRLAAP